MKVAGFVRSSGAGVRQPRRKFFQVLNPTLQLASNTYDANIFPHDILDLRDNVFQSGVHWAV